MKKLYRSQTDKKLCGVLGGLAKYFGIDSTILRIVYAILSLGVLGCPILIYLVAALIIPKEPEAPQTQYNTNCAEEQSFYVESEK